MYIVVLENEFGRDLVFIATWAGDPGRTCVKKNAKRYKTISSATFALAHARKYRDYEMAAIRMVEK